MPTSSIFATAGLVLAAALTISIIGGAHAGFQCHDDHVRYPNPTFIWTTGDVHVNNCTLENLTIWCDNCSDIRFTDNQIANDWQPAVHLSSSCIRCASTFDIRNNYMTTTTPPGSIDNDVVRAGYGPNPIAYAIDHSQHGDHAITVIIDDVVRMFETGISFSPPINGSN